MNADRMSVITHQSDLNLTCVIQFKAIVQSSSKKSRRFYGMYKNKMIM